MKFVATPLALISFLFLASGVYGQDSLQSLPGKYFNRVSSKTGQLEKSLEKKTQKALRKMQKLEAGIIKKISKTDTAKSRQMAELAVCQYNRMNMMLTNKASSLKQYIPSLDTLGTSLKFLNENRQLFSSIKGGQEKLNKALDKVKGLEGEFQKAGELKKFLEERRRYLQEQLARAGFMKELKKVNKQVYYYNEQIKEYKALLKDHSKAEKKALELLSNSGTFRDFMKKNSLLASFFPMPPGASNGGLAQPGFAGLQTRAQLNSFFQQHFPAGNISDPAQHLRHKIDGAQTGSGWSGLKDGIKDLGKLAGDLDMPAFKPNSQKVKSFFRRLEYSATFQSQNAKSIFPATSDLGLSVGYKLNDKSIIGVGVAYKLGWGKGWRNIKITSEGIGLRSFIDWKIKGELWLSGGYEMNYRTIFSKVEELKRLDAWQRSGLLGLTKTFSVKSTFFKKTKLQLLWDFLSSRQTPGAQPLLFRIGYNF